MVIRRVGDAEGVVGLGPAPMLPHARAGPGRDQHRIRIQRVHFFVPADIFRDGDRVAGAVQDLQDADLAGTQRTGDQELTAVGRGAAGGRVDVAVQRGAIVRAAEPFAVRRGSPEGVAGAKENLHRVLARGDVARAAVVGRVQIEQAGDIVLLHVGEQVDEHGMRLFVPRQERVGQRRFGVAAGVPRDAVRAVFRQALSSGRQLADRGFVSVQAQTDLLHVVAALDAGRGIADFLNGGQEQADENRDDRDDHQQLDQREARTGGTFHDRRLRKWMDEIEADKKSDADAHGRAQSRTTISWKDDP